MQTISSSRQTRSFGVNKLEATAKGVYLIAVTPFTENGALDLASTDRMVDFYRRY